MDVSKDVFPSGITEGLDTEVLGRKEILHYTETDSTNARARELAEQGAPEGTLVVADSQSRGRGRRGRTWFSPPNAGIYASLILRPSIPASEATQLTFLTAVASAEALIHVTHVDAHIKWPNDLLVKGKKIAGILTEIQSEQGSLAYAVVGIGMNVHTPFFPDDLGETATSVLIETGRQFSRTGILREYLKRQEQWLREWQAFGFDPVLRRWKGMAETIGRRIRVEMPDQTWEGRAVDVDPQGVLLLNDSNGETHRIVAGDVVLL